MPWRARVEKKIPPNFWADFVAAVNVVYPGATLDQPTLEQLYDLALDEWRNGTQIHLIVRQLCSCDGKRIVPSEAARIRLPKRRRIAQPPIGAQPGDIFGVEDLRDSTPVSRLLARQAVAQARLERERQKRKPDAKRVQAFAETLAQIEDELATARDRAYWKRRLTDEVRPVTAQPRKRKERKVPKRLSKKDESAQRKLPSVDRDVAEEPILDDDITDELINELAAKS